MIKEENAVRTRRRKLGLSRKANLRVEGQPKKAVTAFLRCVVGPLTSPRFCAARARSCALVDALIGEASADNH